ncbi:MAG: metallophosphoesterase [Calditrichaceae bacterium]
MKISGFVIFLTIILAIYGSVNFYIFVRGWEALSQFSSAKIYFSIFFWFIAASFIAGRVLEKYGFSVVANFMIHLGSYWLAMMLYLFLILVLIDLIRLINHFIPFFPGYIYENYNLFKQITALSVIMVVIIITWVGHINATNPGIRTLEIGIDKRVENTKKLNIVVASDIHLGTMIGRSEIDNIVAIINKLEPDIVLLPGDIVDEDMGPVIRQNLGEALNNIRARYGVFAVTGNHEYIGGVEPAFQYLSAHKINVLRDSVAQVNGDIYIVGREDISVNRIRGKKRYSLEKLLENVNKTYPVILLDHQPFNLNEAADNGIDLQVSGHTHHGQLWPFNYITSRVYEISHGYKKSKNTHFYISSGVGTWGPPVRIGNRPEIVNIILSFK